MPVIRNANHLAFKGLDISTELEMEQIGLVVVELPDPQEFRCPMGMLGRTWQADDHAVANLQDKMIPYNLRWRELTL